MKKEDLKIGEKYSFLDSVCELMGFDKDDDPVLKKIKNCNIYLTYFNDELQEDSSKIKGCYGHILGFFLRNYNPLN